MSKPSRGQRCKCNHARIKHNPNAGSCKECDCEQFIAVKVKGMRRKEKSK